MFVKDSDTVISEQRPEAMSEETIQIHLKEENSRRSEQQKQSPEKGTDLVCSYGGSQYS